MSMGRSIVFSKSTSCLPDPETREVPSDGIFLISELAAAVGLEAKTIRYYESEGLLVPAKHGRFKFYQQKDVDHLLVIKKLRQYGFSIEKLRTILALEGPNLVLGQHKNPGTVDIIKDQFMITSGAVLAAEAMLLEFEHCIEVLKRI
jgi:DNA-binding transcriptional MerR regulator